jgi:hypothetical protein
MPTYLIRSGVRRCVAAIRAGRTDIAAEVIVAGKPPIRCRVSFDDLYSPKPSVLRDHRYIVDTEYRTVVLGTEPPEIEISPLNPAKMRYYTHIRAVALT